MNTIDIHVKTGLKIPISGAPTQTIDPAPIKCESAALLGTDYTGLKPKLLVNVGDRVKSGQAIFIDKKRPAIRFCAPAGGTVTAINRGEKRALLSVIITIQNEEHENFKSFSPTQIDSLSREAAIENLLGSGLWTSFRARPFNCIPDPHTPPQAVFVTAIDTAPLAADPAPIIKTEIDNFSRGLKVIRTLFDGPLYVCHDRYAAIPLPDLKNITRVQISGPHPAGLPGTHIHRIHPVNRDRAVWHIHHQDVIAIGALFTTGRLPLERVISLAGPAAQNPSLVRARLGANIETLASGRVHDGDIRLISGSILYGHAAHGPMAFLGRYHHQISALHEGRRRHLLGWLAPGFKKFSAHRVFMSALRPPAALPIGTNREGGARALVPVGSYEKVFPFDTLPTLLLRALITGDIDTAEALGCLELDEEDLAVCTFVCPSKYDFGPFLRNTLNILQKEMA